MSASLESIELVYPDGRTSSVVVKGELAPEMKSSLVGRHILRVSIDTDPSNELCVNLVLRDAEGKDIRGVVIPAHPMFSFGWQREIKNTGGEVQEDGMDVNQGVIALREKISHIADYGPVMTELLLGLICSLVGQTIEITPTPKYFGLEQE